MSVSKSEIIYDIQAIVSIIAGTSSLTQEYQTTVYTRFKCPNCDRIYWKLAGNKFEFISCYPYCANCGNKTKIEDITEDHDVIGAEAIFLQKEQAAYASFKLTHKALQTKNIKQMIEKCNARFIS